MRSTSDVSFASSQSGITLLRKMSESTTLIQKQKKLHTTRNFVGTIAERQHPPLPLAVAPSSPSPASGSPGDIKDTRQALMGPTLRSGNGGCGGRQRPRRRRRYSGSEVGLPVRIQALEKAILERQKSFGGGEGADARRAWEAMKRHILYIEEHGSLSDDDSNDKDDGNDSADAMQDDSERALRERRARGTKGWAEEQIKGQARDDARTAAKKRRRNGGCWTCENGVLMRVVSSLKNFPPPKICSRKHKNVDVYVCSL